MITVESFKDIDNIGSTIFKLAMGANVGMAPIKSSGMMKNPVLANNGGSAAPGTQGLSNTGTGTISRSPTSNGM